MSKIHAIVLAAAVLLSVGWTAALTYGAIRLIVWIA